MHPTPGKQPPLTTAGLAKTWLRLKSVIGAKEVEQRKATWNPLETRTVSSEFTLALTWWVANGIERNMVPTYLDGPAIHKGVWKGQGVERTQEAHVEMDRTSRTVGGEAVLTSDACTNADGTNAPAMGAFVGVESYFVAAPPSSPMTKEEHIGFWEYEIGHIALTERWAHKFAGKRVLWRCDNIIAIAAINKGYSGLESVDRRLPDLGEKLWALGIDAYAIHIPGVWNDRADGISRRRIAPATCEYVLKDDIFQDICTKLSARGTVQPFTGHTLDGYASPENTKCMHFCSEEHPFETTSLLNHDVWISCNYKSVRPMLAHLFAEKEKHTHHLRATLAIPAWDDSDWATTLTNQCTLIHTYPPGQKLFLARRTTAAMGDIHSAPPSECNGTPWALNIWRLD
jgi:hypothetical protein